MRSRTTARDDHGSPTVSVVLATYDDAPFLGRAVESVLGQTLADLELIVIDDGSRDETARLLASHDDRRLRVLRNPERIGLTKSLNRGLDAARGTYIARLDADCIAAPGRLESQVAFLEKDPEIGIVGSAASRVDPTGRVLSAWRKPETDLEIRWHSLLATPFVHVSATMRSSVLARSGIRYDESYRVAQDYDLWVRLLRHTKGANLPAPLVAEQVRRGEVARMRDEQLENHFRVAERAIREALPELPLQSRDVHLLHALFVRRDNPPLSRGERLRIARSYLEMLRLFLQGAGSGEAESRIRRRVARRIAPSLIRCAGEAEWARAVWELTRSEPAWPLLYGVDAARRWWTAVGPAAKGSRPHDGEPLS